MISTISTRAKLDAALKKAGTDTIAQAQAILAHKYICAPFAVEWAKRVLNKEKEQDGSRQTK